MLSQTVDSPFRRRRLVPPLTAIPLLLISCSPAPPPSTDTLALRDTLMELIEDAYDLGRPGAVARMNALYADSDRTVSASGGRLTVSADSVRKDIASFWDQVGRNMREARWTWGEVYTEVLGDEASVLTATWSIPHLTPAGDPHVIEGAWTAVFQRIDGEWKIVHEHLSAPDR